jgi:hypothetical protein
MANARSLWRLYSVTDPNQTVQRRELQEHFPEVLPAPERPLLARFRRGSSGRDEGYVVDSTALMSALEGSGPLDRGADFESLAMRDQFLRVARAQLRARRAGKSAGGLLNPSLRVFLEQRPGNVAAGYG